MPLHYVVLHHTGYGQPHYDLMFESAPGSMLMTWHTNEWPPTEKTVFTPLPEHRRDYLEYEGPVSNDRGSVKQVASGLCELNSKHDSTVTIRLDNGIEFCLVRNLNSEKKSEQSANDTQE